MISTIRFRRIFCCDGCRPTNDTGVHLSVTVRARDRSTVRIAARTPPPSPVRKLKYVEDELSVILERANIVSAFGDPT
jgi:hypothetical protein